MDLFQDCTNLKISAAKEGCYTKEWRIPTTGSISTTPDVWNYSMLSGTGGTFTNDQEVNTTFYIEDKEPPVISGIENGKTYCQTAEFTVTEDNLNSVKVNDSTLTAVNGNYSLTVAGTNTVVATDKSGNSTTITVTIKLFFGYPVF